MNYASVSLRGNDGKGVGVAGAGDRGWGLLATLVGMRVTVALGSRLRGNDEGEVRERRGRGVGTTGYAEVSGRGNDEGEVRGRRIMQRSPYAGTTRGRRGNDGLCRGLPRRE